MVMFPTSGTTESPCFAGMILVVASRAMSTALSASVLTVCTITGLLLEAGRLLADRSGSPLGRSVQCSTRYEFMLPCTRADGRAQNSGKTRRIGLIANWRIRVELSYSVRHTVQKVGMQGGGMTRSGLIKRLAAANPHLYTRDIERIVATVFEQIGLALTRGDRVELRGFGAFSTRGRRERVGRNPRTGNEVAVPGKPHDLRQPLTLRC